MRLCKPVMFACQITDLGGTTIHSGTTLHVFAPCIPSPQSHSHRPKRTGACACMVLLVVPGLGTRLAGRRAETTMAPNAHLQKEQNKKGKKKAAMQGATKRTRDVRSGVDASLMRVRETQRQCLRAGEIGRGWGPGVTSSQSSHVKSRPSVLGLRANTGCQ